MLKLTKKKKDEKIWGAIGEKIKTLRKERKLTQKELTHKIGVTASTITKYEIGQLEPNLETLTKIADTFNISISNLIEDNNSKKELYIEPKLLNLRESFNNSEEITDDNIGELTECIIIAVIKKYNLNIDINKISDKDKNLMFNLASSSVKTFLIDLLDRNS